jgi:large subunit ribosomal protein L21
MYAVIDSGGKQERVVPGGRVRLELVDGSENGEIELSPVLVVDGDRVLATPEQLSGAVVSAKVVGEELGPKIRGFTYKPKSRSRRRWGHRQRYTTVEITGIEAPAAR